MPEGLKYLVDDNGHRTSVLVPVKIWEDLNNDYQKLQKKRRFSMASAKD